MSTTATTPTPPDMNREQARELKQLRAREARLSKVIARNALCAHRRIDRIDHDISANHSRLLRELGAKQKAFAAPLRKEARALRTLVHRHAEGRTPEDRERAAIAKRIAILEGRLGS